MYILSLYVYIEFIENYVTHLMIIITLWNTLDIVYFTDEQKALMKLKLHVQDSIAIQQKTNHESSILPQFVHLFSHQIVIVYLLCGREGVR